MASTLIQLQTKLAQASQYVAKHGGARHKQLLEQNKQYIQEPPTIEKCQTLANELFYTRLARDLAPDEAFESCLGAMQIFPLAQFQIGLAKLALLSGHFSSSQDDE